MAKTSSHKSQKHELIGKFNSNIFVAVAVATFIVIFSAFAVRALLSQSLYQQRVIAGKEEALETLQDNRTNAEELKATYVAFAGEAVNVLGGSPIGTGPLDGDNAKIVLDALPSSYDFPALSSSVEKILLDGGYTIESVGGKEDPAITQPVAEGETAVSQKPSPVEIKYPITITTDPDSVVRLLQLLEASIRPISINTLAIKGQDNSLNTVIEFTTFYQPLSGLQVSTKVVE